MTKIVIKLRSILPRLAYLTKAIKLVWQSAGYWIIVWTILLIFQGILPAIEIYLIKTAINSFVAVVKTDIRTNLTAALTYIAILVGLLLFAGAIANCGINPR